MIIVWILSYTAVFMFGVIGTVGTFILVINHKEKAKIPMTTNCPDDCICKTVPERDTYSVRS